MPGRDRARLDVVSNGAARSSALSVPFVRTHFCARRLRTALRFGSTNRHLHCLPDPNRSGTACASPESLLIALSDVLSELRASPTVSPTRANSLLAANPDPSLCLSFRTTVASDCNFSPSSVGCGGGSIICICRVPSAGGAAVLSTKTPSVLISRVNPAPTCCRPRESIHSNMAGQRSKNRAAFLRSTQPPVAYRNALSPQKYVRLHPATYGCLPNRARSKR